MGNHILSDTNLLASALAFALAALIIEVAQLLGQYFVPADGYRRCQASVMCAWAQHTRLRWRWSQFRYETRFATPEILLLQVDTVDDHQPLLGVHDERLKWISSPERPIAGYKDEDGSVRGIKELDDCYLCYMNDGSNRYAAKERSLACWLLLLQRSRHCQLQMLDLGCYSIPLKEHVYWRPACGFVENSWDSMSPELLYPLAVTTIGDIAVMVHWLGRWYDESGGTRLDSVLNIGPVDRAELYYGNGRGLSQTSLTKIP